MDDDISTSAEAAEAYAIPRVREVHADPNAANRIPTMPECMKQPLGAKSPAHWAYERLILYIRNFEEQLDPEQEVALGFAAGDAGLLRIEGLGYFDPDIVTFYGTDASGAKTQLIQHVGQLNVMLRALPKPGGGAPATRIGFRLAAELEPGNQE